MVTLKVLVYIRLGQNVPFSSITKYFPKTFLKSAIQGLPDGQDGQVGAGHGSHVVPEGPYWHPKILGVIPFIVLQQTHFFYLRFSI